MLNIITNILLTVMSILSSSNVLVTNLEQNQIESQQLMNVLISTEENETQISFFKIKNLMMIHHQIKNRSHKNFTK